MRPSRLGRLASLDDETAFGENEAPSGGEPVLGMEKGREVLPQRIGVGDCPWRDAKQIHELAESAVRRPNVVRLRDADGHPPLPQAGDVPIEQKAEVLHPGEEGSQFVPLVLSDLLREEGSAASEDSVDFVGVKFFVSIEDEVERSAV